MELIRPIVKVGNSAGVILPRDWLNGQARVELVARPLNIKKEIFEILEDYLNEIEGIYLVGSYARGEENEKSDVDVLVITSRLNKKINTGKYSIILVSKKILEDELGKNILPLLPMIFEARAVMNKELVESYKKTKITPENLRWHIDSTKSILRVNEEKIKIDKEKGLTGDEVAYSLVLRLREAYIVDCLIKGKMWSTKELLRLIKSTSSSLKAYRGYIRVKNNPNKKRELPIEEAEKLYDYVSAIILEQEKWLTKRK